MALATNIPRCTPEQYLELERRAELKHEYYAGLITPMPRSNCWHNLITGNLASEIRLHLKRRPGRVYALDLRVCVQPIAFYTYFNVVAVCRESRFLDRESDTLLNPTMIAEVLSPSTESYKRGDKFAYYRQLESLREYVLIGQEQVLVERYSCQGDEWILSEFKSLDDTLPLVSIGCEIALREIYALIKFPAEKAPGA